MTRGDAQDSEGAREELETGEMMWVQTKDLLFTTFWRAKATGGETSQKGKMNQKLSTVVAGGTNG